MISKKRKEVLGKYGGVCKCCGENRLEFLVFDHINDDGGEHRKKHGTGGQMLDWLIRNDYPDIVQILCHNCNMAKEFHGKCPHDKPCSVRKTKTRKKELKCEECRKEPAYSFSFDWNGDCALTGACTCHSERYYITFAHFEQDDYATLTKHMNYKNWFGIGDFEDCVDRYRIAKAKGMINPLFLKAVSHD